jgi:hypothetical protein
VSSLFTAREVELSRLEPGKARAEVEADELGQRHGEMREAVGVDGDALEVGHVLLAQRALDRGAHLAPVKDVRPVVKDAPLIEHVRGYCHASSRRLIRQAITKIRP